MSDTPRTDALEKVDRADRGAMTTKDFIEKYHPCGECAAFAEQYKSMAEAWDNCPRADWLFWICDKLQIRDDKQFRLLACWCVRHTPLADGRKVWDLLTDPRSRTAVEVAERFANGEATIAELSAAWSAAWSAARDAAWYADEYTARDAAREAARDASGYAAREAAWCASWYPARDAARSAARYAAQSAARSASGYAARDAARDAAGDAQASQLKKMIDNPFNPKTKANLSLHSNPFNQHE